MPDLTKLAEDLKRTRDEIRLKIHLGSELKYAYTRIRRAL